MPRTRYQTAVVTVSLPIPLARQVEQARKTEHRTRSGVVSEALRHYFSRLAAIPEVDATPAQLRALKRARRNYETGHTITLDEYEQRLDPGTARQLAELPPPDERQLRVALRRMETDPLAGNIRRLRNHPRRSGDASVTSGCSSTLTRRPGSF